MKIPQKPPDFRKVMTEAEDWNKLMEDNSIREFVEKANKRYYHWEELKYHDPPKGISLESVWSFMKLIRVTQSKRLSFGGEHFSYFLTDEIMKKLYEFDKNLGGSIETGEFPLHQEKKYIIDSLMEEAIASSQLEGAATTRKIAKQMLRQNKKPANNSEQMIVNGYKTMLKIQDMVKRGDTEITPGKILEIQKILTQNTLKDPNDEGKFRDNNEVVIGDKIHIDKTYHTPPEYKKVPKLIQELCAFANDESEFIHPLIKASILHFFIGYIHPFNDGNGRTARALFYWYVLTHGYWMFEFMPISRRLKRSKAAYDLAYLYTETDDKDLTYFINFHLTAIEDALKDLHEYIQRKVKEQEEVLSMIQNSKELNLRQADLLKKLMKNPEKNITITEVMNTYHVVYQTARTDLLGLVSQGYLNKVKIKKKLIFKLGSLKPSKKQVVSKKTENQKSLSEF
jgi:Fic family protein